MLFSRRLLVACLGTSALSSALPRTTHATTLRALSVADLVQRSDRASVGVAVHTRSEWIELAGSRRIVTFTRFMQTQDLLGDESGEDELLMMTLGGKVGDLRQKVPGEATLTLGQEALLFATEAADDGSRRVVGMAQGKYGVERNDRGALVRASRALPRLVSARPGPGGRAPRRAVDALHEKSLDEVRSLLQEAK